MSGFDLADAVTLYYAQNEVVNTIWYFHSAVVLGILWGVFTISSMRTHKWVLRLVIGVFILFAGVSSFAMYRAQHQLRVTGECIAGCLDHTAKAALDSATASSAHAFAPALEELKPHSEWELLGCHWAIDVLVVLAIVLSNRFFREDQPITQGEPSALQGFDSEFNEFMDH